MIHGKYSSYTNGGCRCPLCTRAAGEYRRRWKAANPISERQSVAALRQRKVQWLRDYKTQLGCADCGYAAHWAALDFDHVRGVKKNNLAWMTGQGWAVIQAEVEKCEVVCANCHRIRTVTRLGGPSSSTLSEA